MLRILKYSFFQGIPLLYNLIPILVTQALMMDVYNLLTSLENKQNK